jgi:adenylate cyclase
MEQDGPGIPFRRRDEFIASTSPLNDVIVDDICRWLVDQALGEPDLDALFSGCCRRLHAAGIPLVRGLVAYSTLHPLYRSKTLSYRSGTAMESIPHSHRDRDSEDWLKSPWRYMIENRISLMRRRLVGAGAMLDFPVLEELRDQGLTDYFAYLVSFDGNAIAGANQSGMVGSWSTNAEGGFLDTQLSALIQVQRQLAVAMKVRVKDEIAGNVLAAYLGPEAGRKVLQGRIRLGDGERIHAIVWYSDLRDSTRLAAEMSPNAFLALLNDYFECTAGAVLDNGGEVLRFVGDAVLAIFPVPGDEALAGACDSAIRAVREARRRGAELRDAGKDVRFGIGLHIGDVLFGNIGVASRIEFSVIGPCANEVARIEELTRKLSQPVLVSGTLAEVLPSTVPLTDLGSYPVKGVSAPMTVFALKDVDRLED